LQLCLRNPGWGEGERSLCLSNVRECSDTIRSIAQPLRSPGQILCWRRRPQRSVVSIQHCPWLSRHTTRYAAVIVATTSTRALRPVVEAIPAMARPLAAGLHPIDTIESIPQIPSSTTIRAHIAPVTTTTTGISSATGSRGITGPRNTSSLSIQIRTKINHHRSFIFEFGRHGILLYELLISVSVRNKSNNIRAVL
jgi:hypothetical protein